MNWQDIAIRLVSPLLHPVLPSERLYWMYVTSSLVIAALIFIWINRRGVSQQGGWLGGGVGDFGEFAFPKSLWFDASTWLDIRYFLINKALFALLFVHFIVSGQLMERAGVAGVGAFWAMPPLAAAPAFVSIGVSTLATLLLLDFAIYVAHYLMHKVPALWAFHKVHHSLEKMTPFSAFRMHPIDDVFTITFSAAGYGIALGVCKGLFGEFASATQFLGIHAGLAVFFLTGFHLRHSHIWLAYPGVWGRIFVSPAAHQIHHSREDRHLDKNMGFIFAFWDRAFGTLYAPVERERFRIGLTNDESKSFSTVWRLYANPFQEVMRRAVNAVGNDNRSLQERIEPSF